MPQLPATHDAPHSSSKMHGLALRWPTGIPRGRPRQLRSPTTGSSLFDASPGRTHGNGSAGRARASRKPVKGTSEAINCFVCTPTLEMGVDIGSLDAILMRNVPPIPATYWQRAGRAGRRHRMAVDLTYCRPVSHDRAYFSDPLKLLTGRIDPPAFNLRNPLMVSKHVHATVVTRLHQFVRDNSRSKVEREKIDMILRTCLPQRLSDYLFQDGNVRQKPFDLSPLKNVITENIEDVLKYVETSFSQGRPNEDRAVTTPEALRGHVERGQGTRGRAGPFAAPPTLRNEPDHAPWRVKRKTRHPGSGR